jgi:Apea-like HEPN
MYSFRIRFNRSAANAIQTDGKEIYLLPSDATTPLLLHNPEPNGTIFNATQLALIGDGFQSSDEAYSKGQKYFHAPILALARHRVGSDFGLRTPKGLFTDHGLDWVEQEHKQRVLNSEHGLMVYETEPKPKFALIKMNGVRGINKEMFESSFFIATSRNLEFSKKEIVAFTLFNDSFFRQSADSRFLLLMMAIEALIELKPRVEATIKHVESLITQTKTATLPESDKNSLLGSLQWLKKDSISQAGKQLTVMRLGDRQYMNLDASKFFTHCYGLRSKLVHGNIPFPTFEEISSTVGELELFVSDLLTKPFLELAPQS